MSALTDLSNGLIMQGVGPVRPRHQIAIRGDGLRKESWARCDRGVWLGWI